MAEIKLTAGDDVYVQAEADKNVWNNIYGEDGNDTIRLYQGTAIGGRGNDRFEKIVDLARPWAQYDAAYWNSPAGIVANLAEGWIDDGWGTRDTVVGVWKVHGSGQNDRFTGDNLDNYFHPNGGTDTLDGRDGVDGFDVREIPPNADGSGRWLPAVLADLNISVSADGLSATVSVRHYPKITYTTVNMEYLTLINDNTRYVLADFITPQVMAEQAIAAGGGFRWNASQPLGSATTVSFSFVTQSTQPGFRAFSAAEQQAVRDILAQTAQITQLAFTEVTESSGSTGQLRFGISQQAATKGQAFLPGRMGEQAGDVWMDVESMAQLAPGSEGSQALLHEIGHALGLRHPRNVDVGDAWGMQLREQDDRLSLSVMSQVPSSDGLFRADWGPLDVLALRHLYGSRMVNTADTSYLLGARESAAMTTVNDDGGTDIVDASASPTGVSLDLVPGHVGSIGLTPAGLSGVDNLGISGSTLIENAIGSAFDDVLLGNALANQLSGGLGNDWIDGAAGSDSAMFPGRRSDYELSGAYGKVYVKARDGTSGYDTLINIERIEFADQSLPLSPTVFSSDSFFSVDEDSALAAALPDPTDMARSAVTYRLVGQSAHGSSTLSEDGSLNYRPQANFAGLDLVTYEISSGPNSNRYTSFVTVTPVNDGPPTASAASFLMPGGPLVRATLPAASDPDNDPVSYAVATQSRNGDVIVAADGSFSYQAKSGFSGSDSFSFVVGDGLGGTNVYSVNLDVMPVASVADGTEQADVRIGRALADAYRLLGGRDRVTAEGGNDLIDGGADIDTAVYTAARAGYRVQQASFGWTVDHLGGGADGRDSLTAVERLHFADHAIALDLDGNAGSVAEILRGLFGKDYLKEKTFVGLGLLLFDAGFSYTDVIRQALATQTFVNVAGNNSNEALVNLLYRNVFNKAPSVEEIATYAGMITNGAFTRESLVELACRSPYVADSVDLVGLATTGIEFLPQGG